MLAPLRVVAAEEGKAKRQEELDGAIRNGKITTKETEIRFKINVFDEKINQCFMQVWKRDMLAQLEAVAAKEGEAKRARLESERQEELDSWAARRREQLERLIEVTRAHDTNMLIGNDDQSCHHVGLKRTNFGGELPMVPVALCHCSI